MQHFFFLIVVMIFQFFFGLKYLCLISGIAYISYVYRKHRFLLLSSSCIIAGIFVEYPFGISQIDWTQRILSYLALLLFIQTILYAFKKLKFFRRRYFITLLSIYIGAIGLLHFLSTNLKWNEKEFVYSTILILMSFWFVCDYLKYVSLTSSPISIIWARPFWASWVVPFDSPQEWQKYLLSPLEPEALTSELKNSFKQLTVIYLIILIFENIFFKEKPITINLWKNNFLYPITYRQNFSILLNFSRFDIILAQFLSTLHFYAQVYASSTAYLLTANLAGFKIRPHLTDFWNADRFVDFYFKTTFHYSRLIKSHLFEETLRWKSLKVLGRFRNPVLIFICVFIMSEICLYIGRGISVSISDGLEFRNLAFFDNMHYSLITGIFCAASDIIKPGDTIHRIPQKIKLLFYLSISSFSLFFGFQYLRSSLETKIEVLRKVFGF